MGKLNIVVVQCFNYIFSALQYSSGCALLQLWQSDTECGHSVAISNRIAFECGLTIYLLWF
ncbi:hypothetical protein DFR44_10340 [Hydromonas duriensis]|uniref:Uncharacterized protein n=1 Tax=Hydromonas duriensis TaxID=1527608 RepID=A0A4R6YAD8_9BURK|nr:hypothetical protein DFR44_10340 [Hydromonas duriensis]